MPTMTQHAPGTFCWPELGTTLYTRRPDMLKMGIPPHWAADVSVANADEAAAKAKQLGGVVMMEPLDVMEHGRMAVFQDPIGDIMPMPADVPKGAPSHWLSYFATSDVDATSTKTASLGGRALVPPTDIPGMGRFAVLQDPWGAVFAIVRFSI